MSGRKEDFVPRSKETVSFHSQNECVTSFQLAFSSISLFLSKWKAFQYKREGASSITCSSSIRRNRRWRLCRRSCTERQKDIHMLCSQIPGALNSMPSSSSAATPVSGREYWKMYYWSSLWIDTRAHAAAVYKDSKWKFRFQINSKEGRGLPPLSTLSTL